MISRLELHLAALKTRRLAATPANALEALRKKQQELQDMELGLRSKFDLEKANMTELKEELSAKEVPSFVIWSTFHSRSNILCYRVLLKTHFPLLLYEWN